jgi:Holliday junction DNA helicase RuvA
MIGKLRGKVDFIGDDKLILDVNGVGYNVYAASKVLSSLKTGQEVSLIIETIVREDYIHLYGFAREIEKTWFNELGKVKGVGNKVGLRILGNLSIDEIIVAINSGDKAAFSRIPGIGPKLALRIVSELKGSVDRVGSLTIGDFDAEVKSGKKVASINTSLLNDTLSALESLGYRRSDVYNVVSKKINHNPEITLETLITESLREVSKK